MRGEKARGEKARGEESRVEESRVEERRAGWLGDSTDLVFLGLVGGGHMGQVLDHLLCVLSLPCSRLPPDGGREAWKGREHKCY